MKSKSGERTLLASVVLSSPGPIVVGLGLLLGRSSTQLADFLRRTAELVAIIVSWLTFRIINNDGTKNEIQKSKLEGIANFCVGLTMCFSGAAMILIAVLSKSTEKGNVVPGLVIAILGVITNTWFWFRYHKLNKGEPSAILAVQSKLYRAKSLVDACVTTALVSIVVSPGSTISYYMDIAGSIVVAIYLLINGVITILKGK
jgi:divalent metal cation (Fe/Co/Zn/Cd) transporter